MLVIIYIFLRGVKIENIKIFVFGVNYGNRI